MNIQVSWDGSTFIGESKPFNERRDCAVRALAVATDCGYGKAHQTLKQVGRRTRCGTYRHTMVEAINRINGRVRLVARRGSMERFVREHQTGSYIVFVSGHFTVVRDGRIWDENDQGKIMRQRVMAAWQIKGVAPVAKTVVI
jgi:hypothetical protein